MYRRPETKAAEEKVYKQQQIGEFMTTWKDFPDQARGLGGAPQDRFDGHGEKHPLHAALSSLRYAQHSEPVVGDP